MALNLKTVIELYEISLTELCEATGLAKSWISQIANHDVWPVRRDRELIKRQIEEVLRKHNVRKEHLEVVWGTHPRYERKALTYKDKLLLGGPCMLPDIVLEKIGLRKDPFTNELESTADVMDTQQHRFVLHKMLDAAHNQKFLGVYGAVGSGKTVLKNVFLERLKAERNFLVSEPLLVEKAKCRPSSIGDALVEDLMYAQGSISNLGKMRAPRSLEAKNRLVRSILAHQARQGRKAVLIIDEAHELPLETLKALKRFHEHQDGFRKLLAIIIIGQEELFDKLNKDYRVREVTARIDLVELKPIANILEDYLRWKIQRAEGEFEKIFTPESVQEMKRKLNGANPLMINVLASHSVMMGYRTNQFPLTAEIVELAYKEMGARQ